MFLSNPAKLILVVCLWIALFQGCGWWQNDQNTLTTPVVSAPQSNIPFSTKEPEVFQAEFVRSDGTTETRSFYARKGAKWRFDAFDQGNRPLRSIIKAGSLYTIMHAAKVYTEVQPSQDPANDTDFGDDIISGLLRQGTYAKFEEIGREGNIVKYRARIENFEASDVVIFFDNSLGMIVRQEFSKLGEQPENMFIFETRNVKFEVDDALFVIPNGYRKVSPDKLPY